MEKKTIIVKDLLNNNEGLKKSVNIIRSGGILVFPTETVYGLGANAFDENAVQLIFAAKGRPSDNPLIVHIPGITKLNEAAREIPDIAYKLFEAFSPGPLTVVLPKNEKIPYNVTAGLDTVAVRIPSHPAALALLKETGLPIAAPSANLSGKPSPTTLNMAYNEMNGRVDAIIDGGDCEVGLESTVLSIENGGVRILRPGAVTEEMIYSVLGYDFNINLTDDIIENYHKSPSSPGIKYTHYKPRAEVYLSNNISMDRIKNRFPGKKVGIILLNEILDNSDGFMVIQCKNLEEYARDLYKTMAFFDDNNADEIVAQSVEESGIGRAIMNRLIKASGGKYI